MCASVFIDKNYYLQNKKRINKFINQDEYIAKFNFNKNSLKIRYVEIYIEHLCSLENFLEYMFRKLGKDVIACVAIYCEWFGELKEMNVMIPAIHEKMLEEKKDRRGYIVVVYAKPNDYKLIELLSDYDILYNDEFEKDKELYKESIEDKVSEYRGINNEKPYHNDYFYP
jgi:hypothetical protein